MNVFDDLLTGRSPLVISLWVATWAGLFALFVGTAIAWVLVKTRFKGKWLLEGLVLLALVVPPTVLGYYLLVALGQQGLGPFIERTLGVRFVFAWPGAVVAATIAALPLVVVTVRVGLAEVSREIEDTAQVDGCNRWQTFWLVSLPIAARSIIAGGLLGFLRALGDFGATLMVAGNIPGRTQTLSMAIYDAVQANDLARANGLVLLMSVIALSVLAIVLVLNQRLAAGH
jgi:molybdate transport system permease protein